MRARQVNKESEERCACNGKQGAILAWKENTTRATKPLAAQVHRTAAKAHAHLQGRTCKLTWLNAVCVTNVGVTWRRKAREMNVRPTTSMSVT